MAAGAFPKPASVNCWSLITRGAVDCPVVCGAKEIVNCTFWPAGTLTGNCGRLERLNTGGVVCVPEIPTLVIVAVFVPLFCMVNVVLSLCPTVSGGNEIAPPETTVVLADPEAYEYTNCTPIAFAERLKESLPTRN